MLIYLQMMDSPEDRSKFERLYLEDRRFMFHVANEILHNEQDAKDAVHQSFLKVAENMEKNRRSDFAQNPRVSCHHRRKQIDRPMPSPRAYKTGI